MYLDSDRVRDVRHGGTCTGCGSGTLRQVQMLRDTWIFVCRLCDKPESALAEFLENGWKQR